MNENKTEKTTLKPAINKHEKTLLDIIKEKAEQTKASRGSGLNLALFLAHKEEIEQAIEAGWNTKIIWTSLRESKKFKGGYECFRKYVKNYIFQRNNQKRKADRSPEKEKNIPAKRPPHRTDPQPADRFEFSPDHEGKDLI